MNAFTRPARRRPRGFTLIELLTVIAIIGVLAAIIIPVIGTVRTTAKRSQGISNLRQIMVASLTFAEDNKGRWFKEVGSGEDFYAAVLSRYVSNRANPGTSTSYSEIFYDPLLPQIPNSLHFAAVQIFFEETYPFGSIRPYNNLRLVKSPAKTVLFADNWTDRNVTEGWAGNYGTIQNTGINVWSWPGAWSSSYSPSQLAGEQTPPAGYGAAGGEVDLQRDPDKAKLGFLDGHVALVKRQDLQHRLFDPRYQ